MNAACPWGLVDKRRRKVPVRASHAAGPLPFQVLVTKYRPSELTDTSLNAIHWAE